MLLFRLTLFAVLGSGLVEATNCRTSRCNAAIADAFHCDRNSSPSKVVAALGCKHFYSTTVYRGCTTKTVTKTKQRGTVTKTTVRTATKSVTLPAAFVTRTATKDVTTTVRTDTATQTSTDSTETIVSTDIDTVTQQATVTTGTDTITQFVSATVTETVTATVTFSPFKRGIEYEKKLAEGVVGPRDIAARGYQFKYPSVPKSVKSCFNTRFYSSACSCFGAKPTTVVRPSTTKTVTKTKTLPSATRTVTKTTSKTVTKPQKTNTATQTKTVYQTRVLTTTITVYVTATNYFTESATTTITNIDEVAATKTDTDTITSTVTETVATETIVPPIVGGGSCGCTYGARPNSKCADGTNFYRSVVVANLAACTRDCDDRFSCVTWDYERATGTCRQTFSICTVVAAEGFFRGDIAPGTCTGACTLNT